MDKNGLRANIKITTEVEDEYFTIMMEKCIKIKRTNLKDYLNTLSALYS